eukprot:2295867-Rhodomonas_salina.2
MTLALAVPGMTQCSSTGWYYQPAMLQYWLVATPRIERSTLSNRFILQARQKFLVGDDGRYS